MSLSLEVSNVHVISICMSDQVFACYIRWQRWDIDNCRIGVALSMLYSPGLDVHVYKSQGGDFS